MSVHEYARNPLVPTYVVTAAGEEIRYDSRKSAQKAALRWVAKGHPAKIHAVRAGRWTFVAAFAA